MFSLGSAASLRAAALALAALAAAGAGLAPDGAWSQPATPPAEENAAVQPQAATAAATEATKPPAPAAAQGDTPAPAPVEKPAAVLGELQAPEKPSFNSAVRAALSRQEADAARLPADMRARRQAVDAYYASRGDAPVWIDKGQWTPAARGAFQRLQAAADDGLDLQAYRVYALDKGPEASLALADVALSEAVAAYAFQASGGRVDPARISRLIGARAHVATAAEALDAVAKAADGDSALYNYNPSQPGYLALREELAQWRASPVSTPVAHLAAAATGHKASDAVSAIAPRRAANLEPDILVNMEFWRWLPRELGQDRMVVNVPEFTARLYRANTLAFSTRVIVGKPDKTTPLFSDQIEYLVINPSWNVPQSIIKNEMMTKLDDLRRQGYDVEWVNGRLRVRQPPGERNALGRIKFIFPNDYAVYLHDTPNHNLFAASRRAFSHGCVRVDQPLKLAETLLGPERGWTEARIKKLYGANERRVSLPGPMPIHIVYFTLVVDENGQVQRFEDIYGYAARARALMGLDASFVGRRGEATESVPYRAQAGAATKNRI